MKPQISMELKANADIIVNEVTNTSFTMEGIVSIAGEGSITMSAKPNYIKADVFTTGVSRVIIDIDALSLDGVTLNWGNCEELSMSINDLDTTDCTALQFDGVTVDSSIKVRVNKLVTNMDTVSAVPVSVVDQNNFPSTFDIEINKVECQNLDGPAGFCRTVSNSEVCNIKLHNYKRVSVISITRLEGV